LSSPRRRLFKMYCRNEILSPSRFARGLRMTTPCFLNRKPCHPETLTRLRRGFGAVHAKGTQDLFEHAISEQSQRLGSKEIQSALSLDPAVKPRDVILFLQDSSWYFTPLAWRKWFKPRDVTRSSYDAPRFSRGVQEGLASCPS